MCCYCWSCRRGAHNYALCLQVFRCLACGVFELTSLWVEPESLGSKKQLPLSELPWDNRLVVLKNERLLVILTQELSKFQPQIRAGRVRLRQNAFPRLFNGWWLSQRMRPRCWGPQDHWQTPAVSPSFVISSHCANSSSSWARTCANCGRGKHSTWSFEK